MLNNEKLKMLIILQTLNPIRKNYSETFTKATIFCVDFLQLDCPIHKMINILLF